MLTPSSFNDRFKAKIREAIRQAVTNAGLWGYGRTHVKGMAYITNHRGKLTLRVGYAYSGKERSFDFFDRNGRNVTEQVTAALGGAI